MMKRVSILKVVGMVFLFLAVICGIGVFGSVGAIEQDMVSIARGCVQALVCGALTLVFGWIGFALWDEIF